MITPFTPGSTLDIFARFVADNLGAPIAQVAQSHGMVALQSRIQREPHIEKQ